MRANGAIRPENAFEHDPGVVIVLKVRCCENRVLGHRSPSDGQNLQVEACGVNRIIGIIFLAWWPQYSIAAATRGNCPRLAAAPIRKTPAIRSYAAHEPAAKSHPDP